MVNQTRFFPFFENQMIKTMKKTLIKKNPAL